MENRSAWIISGAAVVAASIVVTGILVLRVSNRRGL
jgi:hypothetical protein